jgi:hypothetical protein
MFGYRLKRRFGQARKKNASSRSQLLRFQVLDAQNPVGPQRALSADMTTTDFGRRPVVRRGGELQTRGAMRWLVAASLVFLLACSSKPTSTAGDGGPDGAMIGSGGAPAAGAGGSSGQTGTGTGGSSILGGSFGTGGGSGLGGIAGGGGVAGVGGASGAGGAPDAAPALVTLSGTLVAPSGGDVQGTEIDACVLDAQGNCDPVASRSLTISAAGASTPFSMPSLPANVYYLIAIKDVNGNGALDRGDYVAAIVDPAGNLAPIKATTTNITLRLATIPAPQSSTTPELVGTWEHATVQWGASYIIRADATYDSLYILNPSGTCIIINDIKVTHTGTLATQGDQITFSPTAGTNVQTDCVGTATNKPVNNQPASYTWRVVHNADATTSLFLSDASGETEYKKQ